MNESYWLSYRLANKPELFMIYLRQSARDIRILRQQIMEHVQDIEILDQIIAPEWMYFKDFRYDIISEQLK